MNQEQCCVRMPVFAICEWLEIPVLCCSVLLHVVLTIPENNENPTELRLIKSRLRSCIE